MHRPILAVLHSIFLEIVSSRTSPVWVSIDVLYYIILPYNLYSNAGKSDHMTCQWCRTSALVIFDELQQLEQVYFQLQLEHQVLNLLPLLCFSHTLYK